MYIYPLLKKQNQNQGLASSLWREEFPVGVLEPVTWLWNRLKESLWRMGTQDEVYVVNSPMVVVSTP